MALPADTLAMLCKGVSAIAASRDAALRPSVMRAVGTHVAADASEVTVYLSRAQSRQLLQDIAAGGPVAVVFSQPSTHRTVQLKASRAVLRNAVRDDEPQLARYLASMEQELGAIGISSAFAHAMFAYELHDLVAASFRPEQAFDQTPGPQAGTRLELRA